MQVPRAGDNGFTNNLARPLNCSTRVGSQARCEGGWLAVPQSLAFWNLLVFVLRGCGVVSRITDSIRLRHSQSLRSPRKWFGLTGEASVQEARPRYSSYVDLHICELHIYSCIPCYLKTIAQNYIIWPYYTYLTEPCAVAVAREENKIPVGLRHLSVYFVKWQDLVVV